MELEIGICNDALNDRVAQLIQKTNQLNLTGKRYSLNQICEIRKLEENNIFYLKFHDFEIVSFF